MPSLGESVGVHSAHKHTGDGTQGLKHTKHTSAVTSPFGDVLIKADGIDVAASCILSKTESGLSVSIWVL